MTDLVGAEAQKTATFKTSGVNATCDRCPNTLKIGYWKIGNEMLCGQCKDTYLGGGKLKPMRCLGETVAE